MSKGVQVIRKIFRDRSLAVVKSFENQLAWPITKRVPDIIPYFN